MDSTQIFALALNLAEPWSITEMKLQKPEGLKRGQLDIYIDFVPGSKFKDDKGVDGLNTTRHNGIQFNKGYSVNNQGDYQDVLF